MATGKAENDSFEEPEQEDLDRVRSMMNSAQLKRRIEDAVRQRARVRAAAGTTGRVPITPCRPPRGFPKEETEPSGPGYRRDFEGRPLKISRWMSDESDREPRGVEKRILDAEAARARLLERHERSAADQPPDKVEAAETLSRYESETAINDEDLGAVATSALSSFDPPRTGTAPTSSETGNNEAIGHQTPRPANRRSAGLAAAGGICAVVTLVMGWSVVDQDDRYDGASGPSSVAMDLASMEWMSGAPEPPPHSRRLAETEAVAAITADTVAPRRLATPVRGRDLPELQMSGQEPPATSTQIASLASNATVPFVLDELDDLLIRESWETPKPERRGQPPHALAADPKPKIEVRFHRPAVAERSPEIGSPDSGSQTATFKLAVRSDGPSAIEFTRPRLALQETGHGDIANVGPDATIRGVLASTQIRVPASVTSPRSSDLAVHLPSEVPSPTQSGARADLTAQYDQAEPSVKIDRTMTGMPAAMTSLAFEPITPLENGGSGVALPEPLPQGGMQRIVASLDPSTVEHPFRQATAPASTAPSQALRATFTVRADGAFDEVDLDALGIETAQVQVTPFEISDTRVHYFHPSDALTAQEVAERLNGEAIDMIGFLPAPPRGMLEIQLAN